MPKYVIYNSKTRAKTPYFLFEVIQNPIKLWDDHMVSSGEHILAIAGRLRSGRMRREFGGIINDLNIFWNNEI